MWHQDSNPFSGRSRCIYLKLGINNDTCRAVPLKPKKVLVFSTCVSTTCDPKATEQVISKPCRRPFRWGSTCVRPIMMTVTSGLFESWGDLHTAWLIFAHVIQQLEHLVIIPVSNSRTWLKQSGNRKCIDFFGNGVSSININGHMGC